MSADAKSRSQLSKPSRWRQLNWRGAVSVIAFFVLWHLAVVLEFAGFA